MIALMDILIMALLFAIAATILVQLARAATPGVPLAKQELPFGSINPSSISNVLASLDFMMMESALVPVCL